jgi:hypothetical protein
LFALTLLAFSACATSGVAREAEKADKELAAAHDAQRAQESSINAAAFPGEAPRCDKICPARESICMSAARICGMDGAGPDRRKAACDDASERCERVRSSVTSQCDCASGLVRANYVQR